MLPARIAELRELQTACRRLLVLRRRVVPVLAIGALQRDDLAHCFLSLSKVASHLGWQAAAVFTYDTPQRRVLGPATDPDCVAEDKRSGRARLLHYLSKPQFRKARRRSSLTGAACPYLIISEIVPAPTVLPPSRIANRRPFSIATGVCSVISSWMLSPGMHISVPAGSFAEPVTSVVRK